MKYVLLILSHLVLGLGAICADVQLEKDVPCGFKIKFPGGEFVPYYASSDSANFVPTFFKIMQGNADLSYPLLSYLKEQYSGDLVVVTSVDRETASKTAELALDMGLNVNVSEMASGNSICVGDVKKTPTEGEYFAVIKCPEGVFKLPSSGAASSTILLAPHKVTEKLIAVYGDATEGSSCRFIALVPSSN